MDWLDGACRILFMERFVRLLKCHCDGALEYFDSGLTFGVLEGLNNIVQSIKHTARGLGIVII